MLRAPIVIIASGSRPRAPAHLSVDHEHVLDSDSILSLAYLPRSLLVIGGGVIASEYAAMFAALGCKVTQADQLDQPLAFLDPELTAFYLDELRRNGGEYLPRAQVASLRWDGVSQVRTRVQATAARIGADKVLVAQGRRANVDGLNLEAAGIALTERRPHARGRAARNHGARRLRGRRCHRPARAGLRVDGTGPPRRLRMRSGC